MEKALIVRPCALIKHLYITRLPSLTSTPIIEKLRASLEAFVSRCSRASTEARWYTLLFSRKLLTNNSIHYLLLFTFLLFVYLLFSISVLIEKKNKKIIIKDTIHYHTTVSHFYLLKMHFFLFLFYIYI